MLSGGTFLSPKPIELIDTLWNVNENGYPELVAPPRINRYIMECK